MRQTPQRSSSAAALRIRAPAADGAALGALLFLAACAPQTMPQPQAIPDEWDFYLARVDDAPASLLVNFWYHSQAPLADVDTLYWCDFRMKEGGEHGMGTAEEAGVLGPVEDAMNESAAGIGLFPVGRLRNHGQWGLIYYGAAGREDRLRRLADEQGARTGRGVEVGSREDGRWSYYFDFLLPDAERRQWMADRSVVQSLESHGDPLTEPRRVDHWLYFGDGEVRDRFLTEVRAIGFEIEGARDDDEGAKPYSAQIHRVDSVQLEDIHAVVMELVTLAEGHGGTYDGWETRIEAPTTE